MTRLCRNGPRSFTRTTTDSAVRHAGDAHVARDRQGRVRRGHGVHVVRLAARRALAVEAPAVPAADAALPVAACVAHRRVGHAEHDVRIVGEAVRRLVARLGVGQLVEVGRRGCRRGRRPGSSRRPSRAAAWPVTGCGASARGCVAGPSTRVVEHAASAHSASSARPRIAARPVGRDSGVGRITSAPVCDACGCSSGCRCRGTASPARCRRRTPAAAARRPPAGCRSPCPCSRRRR